MALRKAHLAVVGLLFFAPTISAVLFGPIVFAYQSADESIHAAEPDSGARPSASDSR